MEHDYLLTAITAALDAGQAIRAVYDDPASDFQVERKADNSPLTIADRRAHAIIADRLASTPYPVLSEEGQHQPYAERSRWEALWIVDPLDGTKEFIKRNGEFTVNIALVRRGISMAGDVDAAGTSGINVPVTGGTYVPRTGAVYAPVAGVIYVPVTRTLYFAHQGLGAYRVDEISDLGENGEPERGLGPKRYQEFEQVAGLEQDPKPGQGPELVQGPDHTGDISPTLRQLLACATRLPEPQQRSRYVVVASRSHLTPETQAYIDELARQHPEGVETASSGSSIKICLVAEGRADIYPRFAPTMEWDTAAGHAIARAAGCEVYHADTGEPLTYNKADLHNPWFVVRPRSG